MKVREIMREGTKTLSPDLLMAQAVPILFSEKISGLPVVDASGKIVGMVTENDILRNILPAYVNQVGSFAYGNSSKTVRYKVAKFREQRAADIMQRDYVRVSEETSVCEAARLMVMHGAWCLPVVGEGDRFLAMVSRADVLSSLLKSE